MNSLRSLPWILLTAASIVITAYTPLHNYQCRRLQPMAVTVSFLGKPKEHDFDDFEQDQDDADFYRDLQMAKESLGGTTQESPQYNSNVQDDDDDDFYRDLRKAKMEKLGGSIPPEQAKEATAQAEGDFLRAMKETQDEFQKAKEELGSDGAVDFFLDKIREEDRLREETTEGFDDDDDDDDDDDYE